MNKASNKTKNPYFSIICPFFNGEKFIKDAINTVFEQTFSDWELILVDDGSTDNSSQIASSYSSNNIKYYKNDNHGVLFSRYYGIDKSVGKYIVFLDCDDLLPNNALEIYKKNIEEHSPDIVFSDTSSFSDEGYTPRIYHNKEFEILDNNNKFYECFLNNRFGYYHNAACFKRTLFSKHKLPDAFKNHAYTEDLIDTYFLICEANSIILLTDVLYLYRKHSESKSKANMSQTDYYQAFLSYNYIYEDIYHARIYDFLNLQKDLSNELSQIPMFYFVFKGKKDGYKVFKKRAREIRNSFLYKHFSKKYKFIGKRYAMIKLLLSFNCYWLLYRIK